MARGDKNTWFSEKTFSRTSVISLNTNILNSPQSLPNLRKEISRVFQQANRRVQNLKNSGVLSPALKGLNIAENTNKFAVFALSGKTWSELKIEYAKAIEFLKHPTSTVRGGREYEKHLQQQLQLSDKEFKLEKAKFMGKDIEGKRDNIFAEYLLRYKDFTGDFTTSANDVADQIETAATRTENVADLIPPFGEDVTNIIKGAENPVDAMNIIKGLNGWGF